MIEGYLIDIRGYEDPLLEGSLMQQVDAKRQETIRRFRQVDDRKRGLIAGLLIHRFLRDAGMTEEHLVYSAYGKPGAPGIHFNVSHSGNYVLGVVSHDVAVGCDIEPIAALDADILAHYFTEMEQRYVRESDKPNQAFYEIWTKKESCVKLKGVSLNMLQDIDVFQTNACFVSDVYDEHVIAVATKDKNELGAWKTEL